MKLVMKPRENRQRGVASVEYVVVTTAIVALLFAPLHGDASLVDIVIDAFKHFQANTLFLLSMP